LFITTCIEKLCTRALMKVQFSYEDNLFFCLVSVLAYRTIPTFGIFVTLTRIFIPTYSRHHLTIELCIVSAGQIVVEILHSVSKKSAKSCTALQTVRHRFNIYAGTCVALALWRWDWHR